MHAGTVGNGADRVGGGESGGGVVLDGGVSGVGAEAGTTEAGGAREGLLSWLAGPYGDRPVNVSLTYSAAEIDAICDHWNRVLFVQFALAGGLSGVRSGGLCRPATVGVRG